MKVIYVIDSVSNITEKVQLLKNRFGNNIYFVVKANLVKIFQTYNHTINAIYSKNLPEVIHNLLLKAEEIDNVVYLMSSLNINDTILNKFISAIQSSPDKIINVCPNYSVFEQISNAVYNIYVKSLFKTHDSLASSKMQYLPKEFVNELLSSHFGNKLFEVNKTHCKELYFENKEINNNLKTKTGFNKNLLIPIIIALMITIALIATLICLQGINYIAALIFTALYILDAILTIIYQCKIYFDKRFFDRD